MSRFEITSGAMVCSDPCYTTDVWCMGTINNVKKGTWSAEVDEVVMGTWSAEVDEVVMGTWGRRIAQLRVYHTDSSVETMSSKWEEFPGSFGVDSGQFGFFDRDHYRKADSVKEQTKYDFGGDYLSDGSEGDGEEWYHACCYLTLGPDNWGTIPNGVVSSSGYGDGSYDVYGLKNADGEYIALTVVFIDQYDDDDEDEDESTWAGTDYGDEN